MRVQEQRRNGSGFVLVTGAPRSGTTFLANALSRHPKVLIASESRILGMREFLRRPIAFGSTAFAQGTATYRAGEIALQSIRDTLHNAPQAFFRKVQFTIDQERVQFLDRTSECVVFGEKDPNICLDADVFINTLDEFEINRVVFISRNIMDVVKSMRFHQFIDTTNQGVQKWLAAHNNIIKAIEKGIEVTCVRYERLTGGEALGAFNDVLRFLGQDGVDAEVGARMLNVGPVSSPSKHLQKNSDADVDLSRFAIEVERIEKFLSSTAPGRYK